MAEHGISFDQKGLGSILRENQLVVPLNQREYAWRADFEVAKLFSDFSRAIDEGDYFLGTIVTIPRNDNLEVVDGQQRLATTALLLAAIRDYLNDKGDEGVLVESINNEFLTGIDRAKRERLPKLRLNVANNELFTKIVTGQKDNLVAIGSSNERLLMAYERARKHVRDIVAGLDPKDHGDRLNSWVSFLEQKALVVLLKVPNDADAYRMFETLNDRGLRTSQADLIKNYLFGRSANRINEVSSRWTYMLGALETISDEEIIIDFLRHALIVIQGHVTEAGVYEAVQRIVRSESNAVSFATTLESLANTYVATFNPEQDKWNSYPDGVRRAIIVFNLLDIRPMRPLILAIAAKMPEKEVLPSFQFLVSLGVRLLLASTTRSGSVETPLANTAHSVFDGTVDSTKKLKAALSAITPSDKEFADAVETARVSNAKLARYYLRSLQMTANEEPEPYYVPSEDKGVINLEHVLPKKPEGNWPQFDEDAVRLYSTRLGNQALMKATDNADLRSAGFKDKRPVLKASPYTLTSQIAEAEDWTPDAINKRQKILAQLAVKTWSVK